MPPQNEGHPLRVRIRRLIRPCRLRVNAHEGASQAPSNSPKRSLEWHTAHGTIRGAVVVAPLIALRASAIAETRAGKGSMAQCVHRPLSQSVSGAARRVKRQPVNEGYAPVVTA